MDSTRADRTRAGRGSPWGRLGNRPRRAVVTLWTLLMLPVLLVLFAVVVEGVHLWLARVELENAVEAAALAAVKEWAAWPSGPGPDWTQPARIVGQQYAAANTILRTPVEIETNQDVFDPLTNPNENLGCEGHLIFGAITEQDPAYVFEADQAPACPGGNFAVRAQVHHEVPCLIGSFLGIDFGGPFTVFACATAMYDCELQRPRLIRVTAENFHCPTRSSP